MPDWTTNYLACHEEDLHRIVNKAREVDFNLMLPMPEELQLTEGSITAHAIQAYRGENTDKLKRMLARGPFSYEDSTCAVGERKRVSTLVELKELGARYVENKTKYGATTWYGWCTSNWGTKWNACDTEVEEIGDWRIVKFETAWSQPSPNVVRKAFQGSGHGFVFEAYDENYSGIFGLGYETCEPVLLAEPEQADGEGFEYPCRADCRDLDFDRIATEAIGRYDL